MVVLIPSSVVLLPINVELERATAEKTPTVKENLFVDVKTVRSLIPMHFIISTAVKKKVNEIKSLHLWDCSKIRVMFYFKMIQSSEELDPALKIKGL